MSKTKPFVYSLCGAALGLITYASMGTAHADTHIVVGGNTDCTSQGLTNTLAAQGQLQGDPVPVVYGTCDGSFAPFVGSTLASDAINQGVVATRQAWDANCSNGERCVLEGFSIGAAPVTIVGNDVGADQPGSNTHVITDGNAWGAPGVFGGLPGVVGVGINVGAAVITVPLHIDQVSGSENRFNVNDAWAADSAQPPWAEITDLSTLNGAGDIPPQHTVPSGEPTATFTTNDGVTQEVYGQPFFGVIPPQDNPLVNPELLPPPPVP